MYKDLTGDGVVEMVLNYHPERSGSGYELRIYTCKGNRVYKMLSYAQYGLYEITAYKKGIVCHGGGHGGEWYTWFKKSGNAYKYVTQKGRVTYSGSRTWSYMKKNKSISKSKYNAAIKPIKKKKISAIKEKDWQFIWE